MKVSIGNKTKMHVFASVTILLWSVNYVLTKIGVGYYAPESFAFLRYFVASCALLAYAAIKKMRPPPLRDVPVFIFGGAIGFAVYIYVFNTGSRLVTASVASFINSSSPVITAMLARIVLKEKIGAIGWVSVALAFIGVGVITLTTGGEAGINAGALWICAAAVLISSYNIFQRKILLRYKPLEVTAYCIVAGGIMLTVFAPKAVPQFLSAPPLQIFTVFATGIFTAAAAYLLWAYALSLADKTSEVTNYMFLIPFITTFLGYVMIGEPPSVYAFIGGAIVLSGVFFLNFIKPGEKNKKTIPADK